METKTPNDLYISVFASVKPDGTHYFVASYSFLPPYINHGDTAPDNWVHIETKKYKGPNKKQLAELNKRIAEIKESL